MAEEDGQQRKAEPAQEANQADMASSRSPLSRSSLEAYAAIIIAIVTVVFPMTWWIKLVLLVFLALMFAHLSYRSPWTIGLKNFRHVICAGLLVLLVLISWEPIREQYKQETNEAKKSSRESQPTPVNSETPQPAQGPTENAKVSDSVAVEVKRAKAPVEFSFETTGETRQRITSQVLPVSIQLEPVPTEVKDDDLPKNVPVTGGTIAVLRFGQGFMLFDTRGVPKGTRIRGQINVYTKNPKPGTPGVSHATIQQSSTGDCSPNIIGSGNTNNCSQPSKVVASAQTQTMTGNSEAPWEVRFTISATGLVQTGDLRLKCSGPVIRASISRINPVELITGSNGPDATDPRTVVYELGAETLSPKQTVTIAVYSKEPITVLSGTIGHEQIIF